MSAIRLHIAADHPAFAGHFPGRPLLPGVSLLAEVLEAILDDAALAVIVGVSPRIGAAKFLAPVRPGAMLNLQLDGSARGVRFEVKDAERVVASGQFEDVRSGPSAGPVDRRTRRSGGTMSTPADRNPASWANERERSNLWILRVMRWIAVLAGRPIARLVLHPITLYFLVMNGKARRESRRYLTRVLQRPATLVDAYRHIHCFAATILDRVYFLQQRHDQFDIRATGAEPVHELLARSAGVLFAGAHLGSFEALRASANVSGARVAVLMYEDNARLINATLAAVAPKAQLHTIGLGRAGAMLALRRWLDDGGMAGMLADRTLPAQSDRSRTVMLDFLGRPARFSDGPFRLAAMLRRPLFFMAGLYAGGNRYELRFVQLADFSPDAPTGGLDVDQRVRAALEHYVALLAALCVEWPTNWFNFYDFWAETDAAAD